ncbi:MAG: alpha/beta hydrolase [Clostridia bacterium]|nr:alpha/beta hydrolase [Clostridia bacterium]
MKIRLKPDRDIRTEKIRIGSVTVLVLHPAGIPESGIRLLWIHGGGYILGMKEMVYMSRAADLVRKFGVTVYSPGYRLAWAKPYPAAVSDCFEVLEYLNKRPEPIMVGGESAGGGLAAAVCMMARDKGIPVAFQMPLYPMISNTDTESSKNNHGRVWNTRRNRLGWRFYLRGDAKKRVSPYAAPAWQEDYAGLPPCYTFVGDGEPFYCETLRYVDNLKKAGVEAEVDVYHTDMHAFDMLRDDELSRMAIGRFEERFAYALEHYVKGKVTR